VKRAALLVMLTLAGCTVKTIEPPVTVTTKNLPELSHPQGAKEVRGSSCTRVAILIIPVGFGTAEAAYADALEQAPGTDALLNYESRSSVVFAFPFYYHVCSEVHGYAVSSKTLQ
jgi:hypothetical protein